MFRTGVSIMFFMIERLFESSLTCCFIFEREKENEVAEWRQKVTDVTDAKRMVDTLKEEIQ